MFKNPFQLKVSKQIPDIHESLEEQYRRQVKQDHISYDKAQLIVLQHLQSLLNYFVLLNTYKRRSFRHRLISSPPVSPKSLYIYGDVGSGKSMLMILFYEACPIVHKRRVHLSTFMIEVHDFIHQWHQQNTNNAIIALAEKIGVETMLLCLDEFHVSDIADAMILKRLFSKLFELGTLIVITSNRHPDNLYKGGIQKDQFLIFTELLQKKSNVIELVTNLDYRHVHNKSLNSSYYFPLDSHADDFIRQQYNNLTDHAHIKSNTLDILGRRIVFSSIHKDIALATFNELCLQPLGSVDYSKIATVFSTLILTKIPKLSADNRNEAKRLMALIDALYEHKVELICTAEVPISEIYTTGDGSFEFKRTVSRLIEMQSDAYLLSKHT
jgi:cell division protein ZapE